MIAVDFDFDSDAALVLWYGLDISDLHDHHCVSRPLLFLFADIGTIRPGDLGLEVFVAVVAAADVGLVVPVVGGVVAVVLVAVECADFVVQLHDFPFPFSVALMPCSQASPLSLESFYLDRNLVFYLSRNRRTSRDKSQFEYSFQQVHTPRA